MGLGWIWLKKSLSGSFCGLNSTTSTLDFGYMLLSTTRILLVIQKEKERRKKERPLQMDA
jgi:hypothetical protein